MRSTLVDDRVPRGSWRAKVAACLWLGCLAVIAVATDGVMACQDVFDWESAETWREGVRYTSLEREYPNAEGLTCPNYLFFDATRVRKLRLHAVRIDTQTPGIKWLVTDRAEGWGEPMPEFRGQNLSEFTVRTKRQTTREFMSEQRAAGVPVSYAVNAAPWSPYQSGFAHPFADRMGLLVAAGRMVSPADGRYPSLIVDKDGRLEMRLVPVDADLAGIQTAVSGFGFCLRDGQMVAKDTVLHPRTGYGLSEDGRYLVWLIIEGRQVASQGATVHEVGEWLRHYGTHHGINMDGGGSTTLARWDDDQQQAKLVNRPAHGERSNGNHLGLYFVTPDK